MARIMPLFVGSGIGFDVGCSHSCDGVCVILVCVSQTTDALNTIAMQTALDGGGTNKQFTQAAKW